VRSIPIDEQRKRYACCVAGGGPAGMMLGYLLARAGVEVLVLEKHADFLRDFRGDTIHPSTLEVLFELGILKDFLALPHQEVLRFSAQVGEVQVPFADFTHLPTHCRFLAFMPQWDFLDFLATRGKHYPAFHLWMRAEAVGLIEEGGRVVGVEVVTPEGKRDVRADLVVGADGRHSTVRERAGLQGQELGAPMDVLWFGLSRTPSDPQASMGRFDPGRIVVLINRDRYWQCGYVIPKGTVERLRAAGIEAFREAVAGAAPWARERVGELRSWDDVKLLTVQVDRLRRWYRPGLLCIGDAAHAMSPVGGVGINLALQDAVATANLLSVPLAEGRLSVRDLAKVQKRREWPTRATQWFQVQVQQRIIAPVLGRSTSLKPPLILRLLARYPILRRIPARLVGVGVRPEHVRSPEARSA
jgi:2-polyprenyl-6-methoxyphenol hydroxylase-like FAD-dependent oxidoreductase